MIPIIIAGLTLIFTGCASAFVNKRKDGTLSTEASAMSNKEAALEKAVRQASNYCDDKGGYTVLEGPQFASKDIPIYEKDCFSDCFEIDHSFHGHSRIGPETGPGIKTFEKGSGSGKEKCLTHCVRVYSHDATKWTAKLIFKCNK